MHGDLANNINFHYGSNQEKFNVHIFKQIKKKTILAYFTIFPHYWGKNIFERNPALSHTTLCRFLTQYQNQEKTNDQILRKCLNRLDGQTERRKNRGVQ